VRHSGGDAVEGKRRQEANDSLGHLERDFRKAVVFAYVGFGPGVQTARNAINDSFPVEPVEVIRWNVTLRQVARPDDAPFFHEPKSCVDFCAPPVTHCNKNSDIIIFYLAIIARLSNRDKPT
jgi:hypothetical protein